MRNHQNKHKKRRMIVLYRDKTNSGTLHQENSGPELSSKTKQFQSIKESKKAIKKCPNPYMSQRITLTDKTTFSPKHMKEI